MTDETKPAPADATTTSSGYSDDIVVVGGAVADEYGVLAEGAVAIQGDTRWCWPGSPTPPRRGRSTKTC